MILVIQNSLIFATHSDYQQPQITFTLYPHAEKIVGVTGGPYLAGESDPTLNDPGIVVWEMTNTPTAQTLWILYTLTPQSGQTLIQADGVPLMRNLAADVLRIHAEIHVTAEAASDVIPLTTAWPIRLRYDDGAPAFNRVLSPLTPGVYEVDLHFGGKRAVRHCLFDKDFATVTLGGVTYQFKQVIPLKIDVYEEGA